MAMVLRPTMLTLPFMAKGRMMREVLFPEESFKVTVKMAVMKGFPSLRLGLTTGSARIYMLLGETPRISDR